MSLPRLTGALRAFAPITTEDEVANVDVQKQLMFKRQQNSHRFGGQGLTLQQLVIVIKRHARDIHPDEITERTRELTHIAREIGKYYERYGYLHIS